MEEQKSQTEAMPEWFNAPKGSVIQINISVPAATSPGEKKIDRAEVANVSVGSPSQAVHTESNDTFVDRNHFLNTKDDQLAAIRKMHTMHEQMDSMMVDGARSFEQQRGISLDPDHVVKATQVAHQVVAELLRGSMALRIPPEEIHEIFAHVVDMAVQHVANIGQTGGQFNADSLKGSIMNHPKVRSFKEKYDPRHSHSSHILHHPETGMPSKTVLAAHSKHSGLIHSMFHDHHHHHLHGGHH
ncbi:MAG: hypothetical protein MRY32_04455 [Rickettsiales bacterium]|nr:hypothetical protein [Rickettsiales bacterium]